MPYIPSGRRSVLDEERKPISYLGNPGVLNYVITREVLGYIEEEGSLSYSSINEVIGVLECVKQELYRRLAAPYEDGKCFENGDVFPHVASRVSVS